MAPHEYAEVRLGEPHYAHSSSSTEVESLVGRDKEWSTHEYHNKRNIICPPLLGALRWVLVIGLQLIIIGLLAKEQGLLKDSKWWRSSTTSANEVGGDITGWGPHIPTQITKFQINQTFAPSNTSEFFKPETLQAWNELMPVGMGFQQIPDPSTYHDLPTPIIWPNATVYTTSMTHQLHCLYAVVQVYSAMKSDHALEEDHHWHMIHCFDYMRQAIMCSADMALEGLETTFPDHNGGSDGWDSKHVCRDYSKVRERLESVRAYDDQEIF
ncbi:hypothetical protein P153DRAFT_330107 [Dothidotthia symphoricarpi CBS 119687]|uniref:DUF3328 domain containing protein n=1 Tax=Dothidotthia symphoricarpi CBS 119687 TaxID=1392245 RepID=A0A6A6AT22_9PLEO|nr:uncharacterized protein P153DRAFT_330107 [Dothidotthia symphoricarpi CBS 119687]KAF2133691.1 hypothetical protein P153DRAFT_330107 [Dothidotthia symphoricarpi CBS 119687]